jgi:catechol 2,3-dioxygenase-like lactoylglutathione lyase family enzyme
MDMKLEVIVVPVADVDRAKQFYQALGWREDIDIAFGGNRAVQLTPPGSGCSILIGKGITEEEPGSLDGMLLVVDDIEAARAELVGRGAPVSEIFHGPGGGFQPEGGPGRLLGPDPDHASYQSYASFSDPDGNGWALQEVTTRLPGRTEPLDAGELAELLREAEERHGSYEAIAPPHHWADWYAAYMVARQDGRTPDESAAVAGQALAMIGG